MYCFSVYTDLLLMPFESTMLLVFLFNMAISHA